jgi:alkylation response protein AidB-like acyl-CoA dehydrogenase
MGDAGLVLDEDLTEAYGMFQAALLSSPSGRIAGGSDEILRNIIAERVLGMPADIRADKGIPFNKVPTGKR